MNGCDPFMYSMPPSYGGVVGVGSSCDDHDRLDLTLRLGLPSYDDEPAGFKFNGNTDFATMAARRWRCGTYHEQYTNISYQCPCPQLARQGWNTSYGGGLNNPNPYGGGWPYGANQIASPHYANSNDDTGAYYLSVGGYHTAYTYGSSSSVPPVSNVSNGTLSRRTTHDQDAVSSNVGGGSRKKYSIRSEHMTAPEEVDRRCTKCNSDDTPMWRKGPLGPKTLCNACGIKYRKDMEKKKVEELAFAYGGRYH